MASVAPWLAYTNSNLCSQARGSSDVFKTLYRCAWRAHREADGLAMSSRNARLSPQARQDALCIQASLKWAHEALSRGEATLPEQFASHISERVAAAGGKVDYVQLVHAVNLAAVADVRAQPTLLAIAAHFPARDRGTVRLIDNTVLNEAPDSS